MGQSLPIKREKKKKKKEEEEKKVYGGFRFFLIVLGPFQLLFIFSFLR